jgi:hypothetical protein
MLRTYTIRTGCSFRLHDGTLRTGGEEIDLEDDVAQIHADKIDLLAEEPAPEAAPAPEPAVQTPAPPAPDEASI